jgi:hypothetical protein
MIEYSVGSQCVEIDYNDTVRQVTGGGNGDDTGLPPDITMVHPIPVDPYNKPAGAEADMEDLKGDQAEKGLYELRVATDYANEAIDYVKEGEHGHGATPAGYFKEIRHLPEHRW